MYTKQHFKKWDRSPIEKLHLKFCERYLEINNKASNKAYRAGHEIAPDNYRHYNTKPKRLTKFTLLATKIHKFVATLATRTLQVPYILPLCNARLNKGWR